MNDSTLSRLTRRLIMVSMILLALSVVSNGMRLYTAIAQAILSPYAPSTVSLEGYLEEASSGAPLSGTHSLQIRLYDQASGSNPPVWQESLPSVTFTSGYYTAILGSVQQNPLPTSMALSDLWLGISVNGGAELQPRFRLGAVPAAMTAVSALSLNGYPISAASPQHGQTLIWDASAGEWAPAYGYVPLGARLTSTVALSIPHNVWKALNFDQESWDNGHFHSMTTNNTRLTASQGGKYLISGSWEMAETVNHLYVRDIRILLNGSMSLAHSRIVAPGAPTNTRLSISTVYNLSPGDYVELIAFHDTAGGNPDLQVLLAPEYSPEFSLVWLAP